MSIASLFLLAVGLSMDAFAVAVCKGLATRKLSLKKMLLAGLWFGGFQALMPTIGYFLGYAFEQYIVVVDHWIAFFLLGAIGVNMIRESRSKEAEDSSDCFGCKTMFVMAVATSIDALAVGIPFPSMGVNIVTAASFIGVTTFILSAVGVWVGHVFGTRYKSAAELAGGVILILLGTHILLEHLGIL